jgi:hypothetical protein
VRQLCRAIWNRNVPPRVQNRTSRSSSLLNLAHRIEDEDDNEYEDDSAVAPYPQSLGKKYAPTASNIPRRAEMGPCAAPLNV